MSSSILTVVKSATRRKKMHNNSQHNRCHIDSEVPSLETCETVQDDPFHSSSNNHRRAIINSPGHCCRLINRHKQLGASLSPSRIGTVQDDSLFNSLTYRRKQSRGIVVALSIDTDIPGNRCRLINRHKQSRESFNRHKQLGASLSPSRIVTLQDDPLFNSSTYHRKQSRESLSIDRHKQSRESMSPYQSTQTVRGIVVAISNRNS